MRKHRIDKIQEISGASVELCPADTPEETAVLIAELLLIAERMPKEKFSSSEPTKIISGGSEKMDANFVTKNDLSDAEKILSSGVTKFDRDELLILEQIQNA
jgi:hypothetical protein